MHNPLRSERDAFRALVIIGTALAAVIALALVWRPAAGAILLALEVGVGLGLVWRGSRGTLARTAEVAQGRGGPHRILVVANQTVAGRALLDELRNRAKGRRSEIFVVVPPLPRTHVEQWTSDVDATLEEARERLAHSLRAMAGAGLEASGDIGDHHEPNAAIEDALGVFPADEVVISTHPPEKSRWLEAGVVERAREEVPLPITHVVVDLEAEAEAATQAA